MRAESARCRSPPCASRNRATNWGVALPTSPISRARSKNFQRPTMGKPYSNELEELPRTYEWCLRADVAALAECLDRNRSLPLLAVGSGGSFTAASFAAYLHQSCTGQLAKPVTPFDATLSPINLRDLGVLILTAGGKNPD